MRPHIRPAREEDLPALLHLENICFKEEKFHKRQLEYLLNKAKSLVLVASIGDDIAGSMIVLLRYNIRSARIYSLNVHPKYRRRGLAKMLIDRGIEFAENEGFKKVTLEVGVNNRSAQNLYKLKGFLIDNVLKCYYKDGGDALHLIHEL
ncbi:MAG TPA: GNAT family N-acetyltransferase [Candidatus Methanoperedens sp.]